MNGRLAAALAAAALTLPASGCTRTVYVGAAVDSRSPAAAYVALRIPPGHWPPPGMCRVWIPGVAPGHQPRPGNCHLRARRVSAGQWIVYTPRHYGAPIEVWVYGRGRRVWGVRYYDRVRGDYLMERSARVFVVGD